VTDRHAGGPRFGKICYLRSSYLVKIIERFSKSQRSLKVKETFDVALRNAPCFRPFSFCAARAGSLESAQ
jgi:hypothetical protein